MLVRYNEAVPNAAERILAMTEKQAEHRQHLERISVEGNLRAQTLGQILAFIVMLAGIGGGVWLISIGKNAQGLATVLAPLAGAAGVFLIGRRRQEKERREKLGGLEKAAGARS